MVSVSVMRCCCRSSRVGAQVACDAHLVEDSWRCCVGVKHTMSVHVIHCSTTFQMAVNATERKTDGALRWSRLTTSSVMGSVTPLCRVWTALACEWTVSVTLLNTTLRVTASAAERQSRLTIFDVITCLLWLEFKRV